MNDCAIARHFKSIGRPVSSNYIGDLRRKFGLPPVGGKATAKKQPSLPSSKESKPASPMIAKFPASPKAKPVSKKGAKQAAKGSAEQAKPVKKPAAKKSPALASARKPGLASARIAKPSKQGAWQAEPGRTPQPAPAVAFFGRMRSQKQRLDYWASLNAALLGLRKAEAGLSRPGQQASPGQISEAKASISNQIKRVETLLNALKPFIQEQKQS